MSDTLVRRHALEDFLTRHSGNGAPDAAVRVTLRASVDLFILRGSSDDPAFGTAVRATLGQPLPVVANTVSRGAHDVYWMGPDEWLIATASGHDLCAQLAHELRDKHAAVVPQQGGLVVLRVAGVGAREVLAAGTTIDLHPRAWSVDQCAQTGMGKASVLLSLDDDTPGFTLVVRRSFADYVARWLAHAGSEAGINFAAPDNEGTI